MKLADYYKNTHVFIGSSLSLFLNLLIWALFAWKIFPQSKQIAIHYNVYFGTDKIGPAWHAAYLPAIGLLILLANFLLGLIFWKKNSSLSYIILYLTVVLQLILLVSAMFLTLANI